MSAVAYLDLARENARFSSELDDAVAGVIKRGRYVLGPEVEAFEEEFAAAVGARFCVGVGNGLEALSLTLRAWGVGPGDEVIVPANTYIATWIAVTNCGAEIVAIDPDEDSMNIGVDAVDAAITSRTAAVIPVHLYGRPVEMQPILDLAATRGLRVLDDAAQAHGAAVGGHRIGSIGDATAWSFYPTKNLGALGDAGAITTSDPETAEALRLLRNYGTASKYISDRLGVNSRLDEIQAAVLRVKLRRLDETITEREVRATRYQDALVGSALRLPGGRAGDRHAWHLYVARHPRRDEIRDLLQQRGVETLVHYPVPPHLQPAYRDRQLGAGGLPVTERIHDEVFSLPLAPYLTEPEQDQVIRALGDALAGLY